LVNFVVQVDSEIFGNPGAIHEEWVRQLIPESATIAISNYPRPKIPGDDSQVAASDFSGRGAFRSWDTPGNGPIGIHDDRIARKQQSWYRNCKGRETFGMVRRRPL